MRRFTSRDVSVAGEGRDAGSSVATVDFFFFAAVDAVADADADVVADLITGGDGDDEDNLDRGGVFALPALARSRADEVSATAAAAKSKKDAFAACIGFATFASILLTSNNQLSITLGDLDPSIKVSLCTCAPPIPL